MSIMNKFADDTKLGHRVVSAADSADLQSCLDRLLDWSKTWCMNFNVKKCKVVHVGRGNQQHDYSMDGVKLDSIQQERDIGVIIQDNLKPSIQCAEAARKAGAVLGQISRTFLYRDRITFLKLYTQFVRCHLEFASPAWAPWSVGDKEILEKIQRRAVNLISGLKSSTYEDKLKELGILSLESRRLRADLIQVYKILKGIDDVDSPIWFTPVGNDVARPTRSTAYHGNLIAGNSRLDIRRHFFSNRVVSSWNSLPIEIKDTGTLSRFKNLLNNLLLNQ